MPKLIKDGGIIEDRSVIIQLEEEGEVPNPLGIVRFLPLSRWLDLYPSFKGLDNCPQVWIDASDNIELLEPYLSEISAIAVRFQRFSDGTGFSTGALLREAYGFEGEMRAFGDIVTDQVVQLRRCGFNAISLKDEKSLETALCLLLDAGLTYQGSVYSPRTPFKFRF